MSSRKIISCASSDLVSDQRVHRTCKCLVDMGFDLISIGRKKKRSLPLGKRTYAMKRFNLFFESGPLFYASLNVRLFFYLLFSRVDIILSHDLDTLPACAMVAVLRRKKLVYDSHEYFTEVPELIDRPFVRNAWLFLEKLFIRIPERHITVSSSIALEYSERYKIEFEVVRNLPEFITEEELENLKKNLSLETRSGKTILYQGSVNVDRGLEEMIMAMEYLPEFDFFIAGEGDVLDELKKSVSGLNWNHRIHFLGKIPFEDLSGITASADLGISIEKIRGKSYELALPNKVFDYAMSGIPVLMTPLKELRAVNEEYKFGVIIEDHDPKHIAQCVRKIFSDEQGYTEMCNNARKMTRELNWENEKAKINALFSGWIGQSQ